MEVGDHMYTIPDWAAIPQHHPVAGYETPLFLSPSEAIVTVLSSVSNASTSAPQLQALVASSDANLPAPVLATSSSLSGTHLSEHQVHQLCQSHQQLDLMHPFLSQAPAQIH